MYFFYILFLFYCLVNLSYNFSNLSEKILILMGYKFNNKMELPSKLIIIGSHTTIYDFIIGLLFYYTILHKKYKAHILMKEQFEKICSPILVLFDKKINLISIKNNKNNSITNQIYEKLKNEDNYIIFLAPEGTRKCTDKIKSGYWYISKNLDIPIVYMGIDYSLKTITLEEDRKGMITWDDEQNEFIKSCKKYVPLYPERCFWTKNYYS